MRPVELVTRIVERPLAAWAKSQVPDEVHCRDAVTLKRQGHAVIFRLNETAQCKGKGDRRRLGLWRRDELTGDHYDDSLPS